MKHFHEKYRMLGTGQDTQTQNIFHTLNVCGWLFSSAITKVILFIIVTLRTPLHHMVLVGENLYPKPFLTISLENVSNNDDCQRNKLRCVC